MILNHIPLSVDIPIGTEYIPSDWVEQKNLADIILSGLWEWETSDGILRGSSLDLDISIEDGYIAKWTGFWKWILHQNLIPPTSCNGSFSTILPPENVEVPISESNITTNISKYLKIYTLLNSLITQNGKVIKSNVELAKSAKMSISFYNKCYFGYSTSQIATSSMIKALTYSKNTTTKYLNWDHVTAELTQYIVYAYPTYLGRLTSIIQDGAYLILGAFSITDNVKILNEAGKEILYTVYVSNNRGAFSDVNLKFE